MGSGRVRERAEGIHVWPAAFEVGLRESTFGVSRLGLFVWRFSPRVRLLSSARRRCWLPSAFVYPASMSVARQRFGELGERIAERWLRQRGWRVMQRRFRSGHRDIDLVVEQGGVVAFVEVKARRGARFGDPVEAVNWRKQKELGRSARVWIARHGRALEAYRFDVVGVLLDGERVRIRHVEHAFSLHLSA